MEWRRLCARLCELGDEVIGRAMLFQHFYEMVHGLLWTDGVHLASAIKALFNGFLKEASSGLNGEAVRDGLAGELLILRPYRTRKTDPDILAVGEELDIHGIGMARGDSDHHCLIEAVDRVACPTIFG